MLGLDFFTHPWPVDHIHIDDVWIPDDTAGHVRGRMLMISLVILVPVELMPPGAQMMYARGDPEAGVCELELPFTIRSMN